MLFPYSTEVLLKRWPVSNFVVMGASILTFVALAAGGFPERLLKSLILTGWGPAGLIGYQFLHAGFWHLAFNMLYLWVFGNAVCEKIGNVAYATLYLLAGTVAGVLHVAMDGSPAVGASGAINGIVGFYLVLYPVNRVNCFYWVLRPGTFAVSGFWLILFWFAIDAWRAFSGAETGTAYWAHLGGFGAGFAAGLAGLKTGLARMAPYDNPTLLDYLRGRKKRRRTSRTEPPRDATQKVARSMVHPPAATAPQPRPPAQPDINHDCPHCAQNLDIPPSMTGRVFRCPACNGEIKLETE